MPSNDQVARLIDFGIASHEAHRLVAKFEANVDLYIPVLDALPRGLENPPGFLHNLITGKLTPSPQLAKRAHREREKREREAELATLAAKYPQSEIHAMLDRCGPELRGRIWRAALQHAYTPYADNRVLSFRGQAYIDSDVVRSMLAQFADLAYDARDRGDDAKLNDWLEYGNQWWSGLSGVSLDEEGRPHPVTEAA